MDNSNKKKYIMDEIIDRYNNKLNEFIDEEKQILDILNNKLNILISLDIQETDINKNEKNYVYTKEIEKTKNIIIIHQINYLFLLDMKMHSFLYSEPFLSKPRYYPLHIKFLSERVEEVSKKYAIRNYDYYRILKDILNSVIIELCDDYNEDLINRLKLFT